MEALARSNVGNLIGVFGGSSGERKLIQEF